MEEPSDDLAARQGPTRRGLRSRSSDGFVGGSNGSFVGGFIGSLALVVAAMIGGVWLWPRTVTHPIAVLPIEVNLVRATSVERQVIEARTLDPYRGLGTWVDGFDYSPPYSSIGRPPVSPADVTEMAGFGVRTIFLQSGRIDDRSPDVLEDRWLLAEFLMRAARHDVAVVAWFLPKWTEDSTDLDHLVAAHEFEALGHRFDGVAVDIEWNEDGLDVDERNRRFLDLTQRFAAVAGDDPIGAIVLPPVQTDVLNTTYWPDFPWSEVEPFYDVWMPMSYWSFRTDPYDDPAVYNRESIERLRSHLADPQAAVHAIGGIGGQLDAPLPGTEPYIARVSDLERFVESLIATDSIGGSIYDWATLDEAGRAALRNLFAGGLTAEPTGDS